MTDTEPWKAWLLSSVMSLAEPAARVVVPVTFNLPLSVIAPLAVTARLPEIVEAPKSIALMSLSVKSFAAMIETGPLKSFASSSRMSFALPASSVVVPVTLRAPESVMSPAAVRARLPEIVEAPRSIALMSLSVTSSAAMIATGPPKSLAASSVMALTLPASSVVAPPTKIAPESVIPPAVVTARLPEMVEAPRFIAPFSLSVTSSPLVITTGPPKVLVELASVMSLADPAARVVVPLTKRVPLCVIAPLAVNARLPETTEARSMPPVDVRLASPPADRETGPPRFTTEPSPSVIDSYPLLKLAVPLMERLPLLVRFVVDITARLPLTTDSPRSMA